ncbi:hypothetical protein ACEN88_33365, partial [Massilia sp. CT11-108]|uniref:hypothetical protein n=1 Tax=Massilia sp. CT11-108 TaxID=3393900 RepID=UPI0039A6E378
MAGTIEIRLALIGLSSNLGLQGVGNQDSTTMADSTFDAATGARDDEVVEAVLRERAAHLPARDGAAESVVLARLAQA